ncbi:iron-sulfur cluster assembly scaffold protein [endosymbiont GvMRE of Glomus versiforme]|uniref:iron-sulfur cluster assembly scaffold protein n=1 Tax=endosymbiont GvMRE of Glomus versiforme TaxID=2039283 RepID=UPI000EE19E30|nr:iron-sulfur cluster assembly scaffold protein [endosymbiont GvMRE of Glomus versiforme]RHZ35463.1 NifU family SUF system FeS assembly protein [endosymbiont GvMRE of Glomus versiforme]
MLYSPEEKRKIILDNYNNPSKQVELEELKEKSIDWQVSFVTFRGLDASCGDTIYLLIKKKDNFLIKLLFSGQRSCLITVAVTNIFFSCLEGKRLNFAQKTLDNCEAMIERKEYDLENCPELQVFNDIYKFPHRVECIKMIIRGIRKILNLNL